MVATLGRAVAATTVAATLIGDVVRSKGHDDRVALQAAVTEALHVVNGLVRPLQPFEATLGDEFQGAYDTVQGAVRATPCCCG